MKISFKDLTYSEQIGSGKLPASKFLFFSMNIESFFDINYKI